MLSLAQDCLDVAVNSIDGEQLEFLQLHTNATVRALKQILQERRHVPRFVQRLLFDATIAHDDDLLSCFCVSPPLIATFILVSYEDSEEHRSALHKAAIGGIVCELERHLLVPIDPNFSLRPHRDCQLSRQGASWTAWCRWTPLALAADRGNVEACCLLLEAKANVNLQHHFSDPTPLHAAALSGHASTCELLCANHADVNATCQKITPLAAAVANGHVAVTRVLCAAGSDCRGVLVAATRDGHMEIVKEIASRLRADGNFGTEGEQALSEALIHGWSLIALELRRHGVAHVAARKAKSMLEGGILHEPQPHPYSALASRFLFAFAFVDVLSVWGSLALFLAHSTLVVPPRASKMSAYCVLFVCELTMLVAALIPTMIVAYCSAVLIAAYSVSSWLMSINPFDYDLLPMVGTLLPLRPAGRECMVVWVLGSLLLACLLAGLLWKALFAVSIAIVVYTNSLGYKQAGKSAPSEVCIGIVACLLSGFAWYVSGPSAAAGIGLLLRSRHYMWALVHFAIIWHCSRA